MVISIFKIAKRHFQEYIALTIKKKKTKKQLYFSPKAAFHETSDAVLYWEEKQIYMHKFTLHWLLSH